MGSFENPLDFFASAQFLLLSTWMCIDTHGMKQARGGHPKPYYGLFRALINLFQALDVQPWVQEY